MSASRYKAPPIRLEAIDTLVMAVLVSLLLIWLVVTRLFS